MGKALAILAGLAVLALTAVGTVTVAHFLWHAGAPGGTHSSIEAPYTVLDPNTGEYVQYLDGPPLAVAVAPTEGAASQPAQDYDVIPWTPPAPAPPRASVWESALLPAVLAGVVACIVGLCTGILLWILRRGRSSRRETEPSDELAMVREIHGSLGRMEQRIETLETLLLDRPHRARLALKEDR